MSDGGVVGWDIGGVNTKVARVRRGAILEARVHPFEIQRHPAGLPPLVAALAHAVGATASDQHAVTMTAELSQMFRTKRDGVTFVLDAVATALPGADVRVCTVRGELISPPEARADPFAVAASNWAATAHMLAPDHPNAILVDIGSTTTDIIPIVDGRVAAIGATDPARLASGELVYTGAVRTPVEAIVHAVPLDGAPVSVSAEGFALVGDVHLWRGDIGGDDYTAPTPDGRPAARAFAGERLARVVCADREMLDDTAISAIADAIARAQIHAIANAIARVRARHASLRTAIVTGLGAFIAAAAARRAELEVISLADTLGTDASVAAPAAAVALLLEREIDGAVRVARRVGELRGEGARYVVPNVDRPRVDVVVKLGGSLLRYPAHLSATIATLAEAGRHVRLVLVPGGGPFAGAVRAADRAIGLDDAAAHWMAVLAMDQYAELLVSRASGFARVESEAEILSALERALTPVLAPSRWLRAADPLPHSWNVTSDSIAAWVAGAIGASRLILLKPPGARGDQLADPYFSRAVPSGVTPTFIGADDIHALRSALR